MMNQLNWNTTESHDVRYLYLTIMRDLRKYCERGYCETEICLYHFVALPNSLIKRLLNKLPQHRRIAHIIIDWSDYASVHRFMRVMVAIVSQINSSPFDSKAFNEAFEEFAQYITKGKRGRD
ncbi:MAG: hypothetical protein K6A96_01175 [Prevotella sp.]|nr:hypothetical protein [Prevotella sp.]